MALEIGPTVASPAALADHAAETLLSPWQALHAEVPEEAEAMGRALAALRPGDDSGPRPPGLPFTVVHAPAESTRWPQCDPPAGSWAYRIHRVPGAEPHWPLPGDHVHFFQRQQNPLSGLCFWKRNARPPHFLNQGEAFEPDPAMAPL